MNYNGTLQIYLPSHWFFQSNNQNLTAFIVDMFHRIVPFAAAVVGMNVGGCSPKSISRCPAFQLFVYFLRVFISFESDHSIYV